MGIDDTKGTTESQIVDKVFFSIPTCMYQLHSKTDLCLSKSEIGNKHRYSCHVHQRQIVETLLSCVCMIGCTCTCEMHIDATVFPCSVTGDRPPCYWGHV